MIERTALFMPDIEQRTTLKPEDMNFVRSDKFIRVYANNTQIEATVWDVRLTFGDMTVSEGKVTVEQILAVVISPQHAKALVNVLANNIAKYEQDIGEIKLPLRDDGPDPAKKAAPTEKP
jgi:hypothetical protein